MALAQTTGFTDKSLWASLFLHYPENEGGVAVRSVLTYGFNPEIMDLINKSASFLFSIKSISVEKLRPEAVMPEFAEAVLKERGVKSPVGEVKARPISDFKGK